MRKIVVILIILCAAWFTYHHFSRKSNFVKNLVLETNDSSNALIVIKNTGNKAAEFNFSLNNKFYSSLNDFIRKNKKSAEKEQVVLDLFDAQINSLVHENLFNEWGVLPLLILNSRGFAICGRQSEVFCQILYNAGYPARSVWLDGHIVSEIFYTGKWHLFDTDRKTYFKKNNDLLGYENLIKTPSLFKETSLKKYMANLSTFFDQYYMNYITTENNKFKNVSKLNNDTFLLTIPAGAAFSFPYLPDYKTDFFPYNTKAKLFLPKGFNGMVANPLILINVEGKGIVKFNKMQFIVPQENELLKASIFKSKKFTKNIQVNVQSDSFALVYMINPLYAEIYSKNKFFINASDSLSVSIIVNKIASKSTLAPIHTELLNQYTQMALDLAMHVSLKDVKNIDGLYNDALKEYCLSHQVDTFIVKKRLFLLKFLIKEPIRNYSEEATFYNVLAILIYGKNDEFKNLFSLYYKYFKYKELLKKIKS